MVSVRYRRDFRRGDIDVSFLIHSLISDRVLTTISSVLSSDYHLLVHHVPEKSSSPAPTKLRERDEIIVFFLPLKFDWAGPRSFI